MSTTRVSIDQTHELARLAGGRLVSLETPAEEAWVRATFGAERTWLGLEYPHEVWASQAVVELTNWAEGEPSHGDREPFAVFNWKPDSGGWNDVTGGGSDRFLALIEIESEPSPVDVVLPPLPLPSGKGALVLVVDGLTRADMEAKDHPSLRGLLEASARSFEAACTPAGDASSGWALLTWGVGPGKSDFDREDARTHYWFDSLQHRLESTWAESTTGWIVDHPEISRRLTASEKTDVRVVDARTKESRRAQAVADVLGRPTPALVTLGWRVGLEAPPAARRKALASLDAELGDVLAALRGRPDHEREDWLIVLASPGLAPGEIKAANARSRNKSDERLLVPTVPLLLSGGGFEPGELGVTIGLADVVPTVAHHLRMPVSRTWWLDGRPLQVQEEARLDVNLLVNGGAESPFGWSSYGDWLLPGWLCDGSVEPSVYRAKALPCGSAGPLSRNRSHFRGSDKARARVEQLVDLRPLATQIDAKGVQLRLSGWLGGLGEDDHQAAVQLDCLDGSNRVLEHWQIGPVGRSERRKELGAEKGVTRPGLLYRELVERLPPKTVRLRVALVFSGQTSSRGACADELELILTPAR